MFAVFGVFAVTDAESANAQTAAVGQVYSEVGTVIIRIPAIPRVRLTTNAFVPVEDLWMTIEGAATTSRSVSDTFALIESGSEVAFDSAPDSSTGLPIRNGRVMMAGDIVRFSDTQSSQSNQEFHYTVRIITDGADLFMARGEGDLHPVAAAIRTTATLGANEFFINSSTYMTTEILSSAVLGFRAATCTGDDMVSDDMLMCRPPTDAECMTKTPPQRLNTADDRCEDIPPTNPTPTPPTEAECAGMSPPQMLNADGDMCIPMNENGDGDNTGGGGDDSDSGGGSGDDDISDLGDGRNHAPVFVFGGLMLMGAVGYIMSGGDLDAFAFSPAFGYSVNESGYSANAGGRLDFRKGDWSAYWSAGQTNANGDFGEFRYSSGGEYKTDFWQAVFSESVQGETANYDLSLSADLQGGVWSLSPVYRMHSRLEEGETETRNSLNLEGALEWNRWTIRPSAGFQWRRVDEFGDNARFRLEAVREF